MNRVIALGAVGLSAGAMLGLQAVLLISMALGHPLPISGSAVATFVAHLVSYADPIRWGATIALVGGGPLAALSSRL